jgi:hypothetical protein
VIAWLSLVGAIVVVGAASWARWRRGRPQHHADTDWGDWPPDQMAT